MTRIPNLSLRDASSSLGSASAGELANSLHHPFMPTRLIPSSGYLLVLNGVDQNRRLAENVGTDNATTTATLPLQMRAPRLALTPLMSMPGTGRVYRQGARWRYRYKNSSTGEFSGLSPIPTFSWNMGVTTPSGGTTYVGQTAYFRIYTDDAPPGADTLELFANTSGEIETWYLADVKSFSGSAYVALKDDNTDDELRTKDAVDVINPSGPAWGDGIMPPVTDAIVHTTARTLYSGLERFGSFRSRDVSLTQGSDLVTINGSPWAGMLDPGRVGQRVLFSSSAATAFVPWGDPTVYRIAAFVTADTFRVYPEIQISSEMTAGATASKYMAIEDDRDGRAIYMSEPGRPWLIDPAKTINAGESFDDDVLKVFALGTSFFAQTMHRIYGLTNDFSVDPSQSIYVVPGPMEGMVGRHAGCVTPFGWVFLTAQRGVRVFDGTGVSPLGAEGDSYEEFKPESQFARIEPSAMEITRIFIDKKTNTIWVAYVPLEGSAITEAMTFHPAERVWRGPHRVRLFSSGEIDTATDDSTTVFGDDCGNLLVADREDGVFRDAVPTSITTATYTGTVTSITNARIFADSGNTFDADADQRLRGCPIWFTDPSSNLYFGRIMDIFSSTALELDGPVVDETGATAVVATGWTYNIGAIRWTAITSYIDGNDPIHPKHFNEFHCRFRRGSSSETFYADMAEDGSTTFKGEDTDLETASLSVASRDVSGVTWGQMRLYRRGAAAQLRLRGLSTNGDPQITIALILTKLQSGALGTAG